MDLNELNQQMLNLQNDFQQYKPEKVVQQKQFPKQQEVNFQPITQNINTTQIKRPIKSGEHRNDINEKMNMLNSSYYEPDTYNSQSPDMLNKTTNFQTTRNNSNYINNINNLQSTQSREPQVEATNQTNNFANYYSHNFDTLQLNNRTQRQYSNFNNLSNDGEFDVNEPLVEKQYKQTIQNKQHDINSHSGGLNMLNVHNLYSINNNNNNNTQEPIIINKINDTGYHKIEEKKTDYRQNINNKLDGMIFDNPSVLSSINPLLQNSSYNNSQNNQRDTRMVIQDSNKDYYRQSSNDRMSQYSPLSRAANIPIHMANMSVNDFYSNTDKKIINEEHNKLTSKEMLNNRMNNYAPLAKTIQYQTNQTNQTNQANQIHQQMKPKQWNPSDVNGKLQNVVYNNLPIISNSEIIKN